MTNHVNQLAIQKVKDWMMDNNKSLQWLAEQIGVSKSLMGHILSGERQFLPNRMIQVANVMCITVEELLTPEKAKEKEYTVLLRGKVESRVAKRHLNNLLFAIEHCHQIEQDLSMKD